MNPALRAHAALSLALLAALFALAACRSTNEGPVKRITPVREGVTTTPEKHVKTDPKTGKPTREWTTLAATKDRPPAKQGKETLYRKDGTKEWERDWAGGKPAGVWRSWYPNGQMRSELFYDGPKTERVMTFWYENGQRRLQGPAKDGARCGHWKIWYDTGQIAEEGEFVGSRREGEWQAWSLDGKRSFVRVYKHDVRIEEHEGTVAPKPASTAGTQAPPPKPAPEEPPPAGVK